MSKDKIKTNFVYKTTLSKKYGLTPKLIRELDPPDKEVVNMHWKSGPFAYLYEVDRVEEFIEQNKDRVERERRLREKLSVAGRENYRKRLKKEIAEATKWAESVPIEICDLPSDLERICAKNSDKEFRSHIRHRWTNYDLVLQKLYEYRSDLQDEIYPVITARFEDAVEEAVQDWELEQHRNRVAERVEAQGALPVIAPTV